MSIVSNKVEYKATDQQQAILDAIRDSDRNISVVARAGCGKTATILMAVDTIQQQRPNSETTICAFNKAIADEMRDKLKARGHSDFRRVQASTLHSLGFGLVRFVFNSPKVDDKKVRDIVRQDNSHASDDYGPQIIKMVKMAKQEGFGFFGDRQIGDLGAWYRMADHYDINGFDDTTDLDAVIEVAQRVYQRSLRITDVVDFDDMILFPLVKNLRVKFQKDYLFVDEAQDLSRTRQALARKFVKSQGRMIIVGDDRQAIYGFSGADADALSNLSRQLDVQAFPLSVTWRCPRSVVALAQGIVPDIEAAPEAPEGRVDTITELPTDMGPETAILCRNTAPLINMAYSLIKSGTPCKVEGRDIGEGLKTLVNRWKIKSIDAYLHKLDEYEAREVQKNMAKDKEERAEQVKDKCETIRVICKECLEQGKKNVTDVVAFIDELFADGNDRVTTLATYHRSKGREWPRVILLQHHERCPSPWAKQEWQLLQEHNLAYVAFTRSERELLFYE